MTGTRSGPGRAAVIGILRWGVGLGLLAFLLSHLDSGEVLARIGEADLRFTIPSIAGLVAVHLIGTATWRQLVLGMTGLVISWRDAIRVYYVAQGVGVLTPGNLGADVYRLVAARHPAGWRQTAAPLIVQRVTSSVGLAFLGIAALAVFPGSGDLAPLVTAGAAILAVASSLLAVFLVRPFRQEAASAGEWTSPALLMRPAAIGLLLGIAFHSASIVLGLGLVVSVTPVVDPLPVLACLAIARLSILVPISPSGLGVQEGLLSLLFLRIGLPAEAALAAALLNRAALLLTVAMAGLLLGMGRGSQAPSVQTSSAQRAWPATAGPPPRIR